MTNKTVYIFPGQGSQFIGMGADLARDFAEAKDVFSEIDEALHQNLSALMFSGELAELTQTQNAQPAIMAVSMAVWRVLQANSAVNVDAVAGHSLGEYSALCAADVLSLSETAQLLQARGQAMARACNQQKGGMLALLGATVEQAAEIAKASDCYVANDNAPGQIVLSGVLSNLEKAKELAEKMVIKRAIPLSVAGAFHSPLMQSAADEMAPVLAKVKFAEPKIPVFFNVTANIDADPMHYADLLTRQITAPVRWRELIENTNATRFVECGPGNVLCGLVRRIVPEAENVALGTTESIKSFPGK
ncbi:MAG: ACP S-malonyltransferase [Alphaproteobacteria bacterium]|nr:ACP S-malonyltransferase [Alphaproteobacteria bacterium]